MRLLGQLKVFRIDLLKEVPISLIEKKRSERA